MAESPFEIIKKLEQFEWLTKKGLLAYSIGIFLLSAGTIFTLEQLSVDLVFGLILGIIFSAQILHLIIWFVVRNFFFDSKFLTVAFAISTEENSKAYYQEIQKGFKEQIRVHNLQNNLKIKELPSDIKFVTNEEAEHFIKKKGIRLLVWGNTNEGNVKNAPYTQFNIKLSYQYHIPDERLKKIFISDVGMAVQRSLWGVWKPNSFHQLLVVSGNIFEISMFTLAACLATVPNIDYLLKSVDIFERLNESLKNRKQDANFPNLSFVKQKTRSILRDLDNAIFLHYWNVRGDLDKSIEYANKAIQLDENNFLAHQNMSVFQWIKGDKELARHHTKRAWEIRPGHPLPRFNKAFFHIYDRKFDLGLKQYKKIKDVSSTNIIDVIAFNEKEFKKMPDNLGLLFVAGWLNVKFADQIIGISQLKEFVDKTRDTSEYIPLRKEAENMLTNLPTTRD